MAHDLIIKGKYILTTNERMEIITNGAIVIDKGEIVKIVDARKAGDRAGKVIDAGNSIVMPGFVNTHTHAAMTYFRGLADDLPLDEWLEKHIWPAEARFVNPGFVRDASDLACLEMVRAGITCFNDMYFFQEQTAESARAAGLRAIVGECTVNFPTPSCKSPDDALARVREAVTEYAQDDLIDVFLNPHSIYALDREYLLKFRELAEEYRLPIHMHVSETRKERDDSRRLYGKTPVEFLHDLGKFDHDVIAVHSVWMDHNDIDIFAKNNVKVSHNPVSNMKLASGITPVTDMMKSENIPIGLATDGAASNNVLDLFSDMRSCALLHKVATMDPTAAPAREIVRMATIGGARVLGKEALIGSLEPGKRADVITIGLDKPHLAPIYDPYSHLAYCANAADVDNVIVNGRVLMRNRELMTLDEEKILSKANDFSLK